MRLLERTVPDGILVGIDRDEAALASARIRLRDFLPRVRLWHGNFSDLKRCVAESGVHEVHGIVFDLGVSSPQIDRAERGFSFREDGPLDMRMDQGQGRTAADLVRGFLGSGLGGSDLSAWRGAVCAENCAGHRTGESRGRYQNNASLGLRGRTSCAGFLSPRSNSLCNPHLSSAPNCGQWRVGCARTGASRCGRHSYARRKGLRGVVPFAGRQNCEAYVSISGGFAGGLLQDRLQKTHCGVRTGEVP